MFLSATENRLSFLHPRLTKKIFTNICFPLENILIIWTFKMCTAPRRDDENNHFRLIERALRLLGYFIILIGHFHYGVIWRLQLSESFSFFLLFAPHSHYTKFEFERENEMNTSICSQMMQPSWKSPGYWPFSKMVPGLLQASIRETKQRKYLFFSCTITLYKAVLCHLFSLFDSHRDSSYSDLHSYAML